MWEELLPFEKTSRQLYYCKKLEVKAETQILVEAGNGQNDREENEAMGKLVRNKLGVPEGLPRRAEEKPRIKQEKKDKPLFYFLSQPLGYFDFVSFD